MELAAMKVRAGFGGVALIALFIPSAVPAASPAALQPALESIRSDNLLRHIERLSSDEFEGRAPGTRGEELTVRYLIDQFRKLGLTPGNPDGSFVQKVPLMGVTSDASVSIQAGLKPVPLLLPADVIATSLRFQPEVKVTDSEMVFVGYAIVAPEYGWDDYKGADLHGKTLVMLVNDPPIPDPTNPARLDEKMFQGRAMTYYGRWTYKYEIAAAKGAAAAIIVHETEQAGYPYQVLVASQARENFDLQSPDRNQGVVPVQGWMTLGKARELCTLAGHDFETLKQAAVKKEFKPVPLGARASFAITNRLREVSSQNVVAKISGSDAALKTQCVVFTAHWDHRGRNEQLSGDQM